MATKKKRSIKQVDKKATVFSSNPWLDSQYQDRTLYDALGFPAVITYADYLERYRRQDVAHRIIQAPSAKTWSEPPEVYDNTDSGDGFGIRSTFETAYDNIATQVDLYTHLLKLDMLGSLGRYSVLFLGYSSDTLSVDQPVNNTDELMYVKPFGENHIQIMAYEYDVTSIRYGKPLIYELEVASDSGKGQTIMVHWSRVIHVAIDTLDEDLYGIPAMEPIYNRLLGLEKIAGSAPEMYWNGARAGLVCKASADSAILTEDDKKELSHQLDMYFQKMRRTITTDGLDIESLTPQVVSPAEHVDTQLRLISVATQIPIRILTGSERGELASTQDERNWLKYIEERREQVGVNAILKPLINQLILNGTLPEPKDNFYIKWNDLLILSEKETAEIGLLLAQTLDVYASNPTANAIYPPEFFFKDAFGKSNEEISKMDKTSNAMDNDSYLDKDLEEYPKSIDVVTTKKDNLDEIY